VISLPREEEFFSLSALSALGIRVIVQAGAAGPETPPRTRPTGKRQEPGPPPCNIPGGCSRNG